MLQMIQVIGRHTIIRAVYIQNVLISRSPGVPISLLPERR